MCPAGYYILSPNLADDEVPNLTPLELQNIIIAEETARRRELQLGQPPESDGQVVNEEVDENPPQGHYFHPPTDDDAVVSAEFSKLQTRLESAHATVARIQNQSRAKRWGRHNVSAVAGLTPAELLSQTGIANDTTMRRLFSRNHHSRMLTSSTTGCDLETVNHCSQTYLAASTADKLGDCQTIWDYYYCVTDLNCGHDFDDTLDDVAV